MSALEVWCPVQCAGIRLLGARQACCVGAEGGTIHPGVMTSQTPRLVLTWRPSARELVFTYAAAALPRPGGALLLAAKHRNNGCNRKCFPRHSTTRATVNGGVQTARYRTSPTTRG